VLGATTKSLNLVLRAESSSLSFFKLTAAMNFCGKIAPNKLPSFLCNGMILAPFSNISLAYLTVKSS